MDYLNKINDLYPIRKTEEEKADFINYIKEEVKKYDKQAEVELLDNKHKNIVIGDIKKAKVILTAHYDTPATSLIPNLIMPRNPILAFLYAFSFPIVIALISVLLTYGISYLLGLQYIVWAVMFLIVYFAFFFLATRAFKNKHNKNDNTSGVAGIMNILSKCSSENVCYVLFDNEEKGLLGSRSFNKKYKDILSTKLVINLDCIGNGKNIIVISSKEAKNHQLHSLLEESLISNESYNVKYFGSCGSTCNSDHKNFVNGIGIVACHKIKVIGYITPRIHTNKDTVAETENIDYISNGIIKFIDKI